MFDPSTRGRLDHEKDRTVIDDISDVGRGNVSEESELRKIKMSRRVNRRYGGI